jgi:hypothetical protein
VVVALKCDASMTASQKNDVVYKGACLGAEA